MFDTAWMRSLKVGDVVAKSFSGFTGHEVVPVVVERVTPTLVILKTGEKFRRHDGRMVKADKWHRSELMAMSDEIHAHLRRQTALRFLRAVDWCSVDDATLYGCQQLLQSKDAK